MASPVEKIALAPSYVLPVKLLSLDLTAHMHNLQKWKSIFLTCSCHEIDRVEAVGLSISNHIVNMRNLGQFCENWYSVNNYLIKVRI